MKSGYIYVLVHPSEPDLYKIGVTTRTLEQRLTQHNTAYNEYTDKIVKETGQKWRIKEFHKVPDVYYAETVFWGATPFANIPYLNGIEVQKMSWEEVQKGLEAALKAGIRPNPTEQLPDYVYAYTARMKKRLEGRGITLIGYVKSMVSGKANFRCDNGHEWRTRCMPVAQGEGCPECGIGERTKVEIERAIKAADLCLMTHPDKPELVRIELDYEDKQWGDWVVHRHRYVEEATLAESLIWQLLGHTQTEDHVLKIELSIAEQAIRDLDSLVKSEIALVEK